MNSMTPQELLAALESGEGGRELDAEIFELCGGVAWGRAYMQAQEPCGCPLDMARSGARKRSPYYTTSLDAAVSLVPEGYWWKVNDDADPDTCAQATVAPIAEEPTILVHAPTPARALCAAIVRMKIETRKDGDA